MYTTGSMTRVFKTALLACCWTQFILGAPQEKTLTAVHIQSEIVVDGNLDEEVWNLAQPATDFVQKDPSEGEPATERTEVSIRKATPTNRGPALAGKRTSRISSAVRS